MRVLEDDINRAVRAVEAYRDRGNSTENVDNTLPVSDEFWNDAQIPAPERIGRDQKPLSWGGLIKRIQRANNEGRYQEWTVRVIDYLLADEAWSPASRRARSSRPDSDPGDPKETEALRISCPNTIFDHRAVIVGQLPRSGLWPAVFVKPKDGQEYWYPQCGHHNPLLVDRAFACLAHFGNPNAIGHRRKRLPQRFDVRVYALTEQWADPRRLPEQDLESRVGPLRAGNLRARGFDLVEMTGMDEVTRNRPGIDGITASDAKGPLQLVPQREIRCQAPIVITWDGAADARIEIRSGDGDMPLWSEAVASGVTLTAQNREVTGDEVFVFPELGLYRVKLYAQKPSFLDPLWEWWFDVS